MSPEIARLAVLVVPPLAGAVITLGCLWLRGLRDDVKELGGRLDDTTEAIRHLEIEVKGEIAGALKVLTVQLGDVQKATGQLDKIKADLNEAHSKLRALGARSNQ